MTFASWLRGLARGSQRTQSSPRPALPHSRRSTRRLAVEALEDRTVPTSISFADTSAAILGIDYTVNRGSLRHASDEDLLQLQPGALTPHAVQH